MCFKVEDPLELFLSPSSGKRFGDFVMFLYLLLAYGKIMNMLSLTMLGMAKVKIRIRVRHYGVISEYGEDSVVGVGVVQWARKRVDARV